MSAAGSDGDLGPTVNIVLWAEMAVGLVFVLLRLYTRRFIVHNIGWDDYAIVLTWTLLVAFSACITTATGFGLGQKRADILPSDYVQAMKYEVIGQSVCILVVGTSKSAVALFLLRIVVERWHIAVLWFCIVSASGLSAFCAVMVIVQCIPVEKTWNPSVPGTCWLDFPSLGLTTAAWGVVMDFFLAVFPSFIVWNLNMKRKEKLTVAGGLGFGIVAGVCGIVRTVALTSLTADEYIYDTVGMLLWSGTEGILTILCASVCALRPLYVTWRKKGIDSGTPAYQLSDIPQEISKPRKQSNPTLFDRTEAYETKVAGGGGGGGGGDNENENESERSILRSDSGRGGHCSGIKREVQVEITFETRHESVLPSGK